MEKYLFVLAGVPIGMVVGWAISVAVWFFYLRGSQSPVSRYDPEEWNDIVEVFTKELDVVAAQTEEQVVRAEEAGTLTEERAKIIDDSMSSVQARLDRIRARSKNRSV